MFLFLRVLFAHFIADFPLQTGKVYILKAGGGVGKWAHTLIVFLVSVVFVYPYWGDPDIWLYLVGATLVHHLSDWLKVLLNQRGSPRYFLFRYMGDQVVHLATAAFVFLMAVGQKRLDWPGGGLWATVYNSDFWMLYGSLLMTATYFATYFIEAFKKSYVPTSYQEVLPQTYKYYGILERACLFNLAFLGGFSWVIAPIALLPRYILARSWPHVFNHKVRCNSFLEISLTALLGLLPGLALRTLTSS